MLLVILFVLPFFIYKAVWIIRAVPATGTMCFMGKSLNGQFSSEYPVIKFTSTGKDTVFFNGSEGIQLQPGQQVPLLYNKKNPATARVYTFKGLWVDTIINAVVPLVILFIVFLHPDLIPRRSKIIIGKKPFIQLV
ncbi:MAG: DUF3592 domain-containing protein [Chitinophagaceae bacterium]